MTSKPSAHDASRLDAVAPSHWDDRLERFEDALGSGRAPELAPYLAESDASRGSLLIELVRCYQSYREGVGGDAGHCLSELVSANAGLRDEIYEAFGALSTRTLRSGPEPMGAASVRPELFGPYALVHPLGAGGFGQVDLAFHPHDMQLAVLKRVPPAAIDGGVRVRVLREEHKTLLRLRNVEGVPRCIQWVENERGEAALAIEYVAGDNLKSRIAASPPSQDQVVSWVHQLSLLLQEVHDHKVFHCDLKPENVLIEAATSRARLIDFGLSVASPRGDWRPLRPAPSGGTWSYLAPEIAASTTPSAAKVDVFGIGGLMYYLLTGEAPFAAREGRSAMDRALGYDLDWSLLDAAAFDPRLKELCRGALAKDPTDRPRCPRDIAERLRPLLPFPLVSAAVSAAPARGRLHTLYSAGAAVLGAACLAAAMFVQADRVQGQSVVNEAKSNDALAAPPAVAVEDLAYALADGDAARLAQMQPPGAPIEPLQRAMQMTPANSTSPAFLSFVAKTRDNPEAAYWLAGQLRAGLDPDLRLPEVPLAYRTRVRSDLLHVALVAQNARIAEILLGNGADPRPLFNNTPYVADDAIHHFLFPKASLRKVGAFNDQLPALLENRLRELGVQDCPLIDHPKDHPLGGLMVNAGRLIETFDRAADLNRPSNFTPDRLRQLGWTVPEDLPSRFAYTPDATPSNHLESSFVKRGTREPYRTYPYKGLSSWGGETPLSELSFLRVLQGDRREAWVAVVARSPPAASSETAPTSELLLAQVSADLSAITLYACRKPQQLVHPLKLISSSFLPANHDGSISELAPSLLPGLPSMGPLVFNSTLPREQQERHWRRTLSGAVGLGSWDFATVLRTLSPWCWCTPLATASSGPPAGGATAFNGRLVLRYVPSERRLVHEAATFVAIE